MGKYFKGFSPDGFMLLEINKFNDSRDFYESVKEDIKNKTIIPMRQLAMELSDELYAVDDKMNLVPTKMVSRIRRDTRFSKNKQLYRSNVWCMFMRDKHQYGFLPCMWFEIFPDSYSYGVGIFHAKPSDMEVFRELLRENQSDFAYALRQMDIVGALPFTDSFKRAKEGTEAVDEELRAFYNSKYFGFVYTDSDISKLIDGSIERELRYAIRAFTPMYKFILRVTEKICGKGEQ